MSRRTRHPTLNVFLNSRLVGQLQRDTSGAISFRYDESWVTWPNAIPVSLSLPLRPDAYRGAPVFAVFDNLLPDNQDLRTRVAARVGAAGTDAHSLLAAVGRDCVGALQFLPDGHEPDPAGTVKAEPLSDADIESLLVALRRVPLGVTADDTFRISIAGAQEKTALLWHHNRWCRPVGTTATSHILKVQIGHLQNGLDLSNSVENEYLCLKLTKQFGLPSAHVEIHDFGGQRVLAVERFDRFWTDDRLLRVPQEDCCQALSLPPTLKYEADGGPGLENILRLLRDSDTPFADQRSFLAANVLFWLLGATDGHAKNFSVALGAGGRYSLTPLYDVISAQPSLDDHRMRRKSFRLAMAVGDNKHYVVDEILPRHFEQSARNAGVGKDVVHSIFSELSRTADTAFNEVSHTLPEQFPQKLFDSVFEGAKRRLELLR